MNVTEFAEQIVFGKTLEDKLVAPGRLTLDGDVRNRPDVRSLVSPGRPVGLQMRHDLIGASSPPSDDQLENERARGQLLHFLANHELLATELMALVLLKFPEAPHAFRQGILVTLQEEQNHTRMYMKRMRECGIEFGAYPLGGRFWRVVEPMQSPMDFVSRLSLTFEQANLDYSLHFANVFGRLGDSKTAGLLQKIYEDEIGHVQHGLRWFRQWKNPEQSDWEAYQDSLDYPMSPQRGRGPRAAFNREGRVLAGLTDDFIDSIEVFRQSNARPPTVRWFDPSAESELTGEGESHLLDQLGKDLELVMVPVARQGDIVLVREIPSRDFRKQLIDVGFDLPEFVALDSRLALEHRKLGEFAPWAWTPNNHRVAEPLVQSVLRSPPEWSNEHTVLFRKSWSVNCLGRWLSQGDQNQCKETPTPDWFSKSDCVAIEIFELADVQEALDEIRSRGFEKAVFKLDLGASGRGQRRFVTGRQLDKSDEAWLRSVFKSSTHSALASPEDSVQRAIGVLEPELERVVDLSFLWDVRFANSNFTETLEPCARACEDVPRNRSTKFLGWTRSLVTVGRKYVGTRLSKPFFDCAPDVRRFLLADRGEKLRAISNWLEPRLAAELSSRNFTGGFGVDAFLYRGIDGQLLVKPVVEFNPRMTMGHVALAMQKKVAPGVVAEFRVLTKLEWNQLPDSTKRAPLETIQDGRWSSGIVRLSEINESTKLVPVVLIGNQMPTPGP
ncbi:DUF455 family protein [Aporhodopirellula aestuarii]|uniref:Ferritin-like domain-containing protein n=1 Tax=Aporhodopirellula aestuarii TaxID=2950107 RepID=A0ABT0UD38_9BACT|nr:DUF455 family protein [Aporhodopirellula aestuarii]MCM2374953.1 ferritin-like domain-containing protein [Aporhodopirellula aestuarii]